MSFIFVGYFGFAKNLPFIPDGEAVIFGISIAIWELRLSVGLHTKK